MMLMMKTKLTRRRIPDRHSWRGVTEIKVFWEATPPWWNILGGTSSCEHTWETCRCDEMQKYAKLQKFEFNRRALSQCQYSVQSKTYLRKIILYVPRWILVKFWKILKQTLRNRCHFSTLCVRWWVSVGHLRWGGRQKGNLLPAMSIVLGDGATQKIPWWRWRCTAQGGKEEKEGGA